MIRVHEFKDLEGCFFIGIQKSKVLEPKKYKSSTNWINSILSRKVIKFKTIKEAEDYYESEKHKFRYDMSNKNNEIIPVTKKSIIEAGIKKRRSYVKTKKRRIRESVNKKIKEKIRKGRLYGYGINDINYKPTITDASGNKTTCKIYQTWHSMINRCYSENMLKRNNTYVDVTVCNDWLRFGNFKRWMEKQDYEGKYLDKDILSNPDKKIYSPDTCLFVDSEVNNVFRDITRSNIAKEIGSLRNQYGTFNSFYRKEYLGTFNSIDESREAYKIAKSKYLVDLSRNQNEIVKKALINLSDELLSEFS